MTLTQLELMSGAARRYQASESLMTLHSVFAAVASGMTGKSTMVERMDEDLKDVIYGE